MHVEWLVEEDLAKAEAGDGLGNGRDMDTGLRGEPEVFPRHTIQAEAPNLFKPALIKGTLMVRMEWQPPAPDQDGSSQE